MKTFQKHAPSKKNPGRLDFWSLVLPIAFDLVCGLLLIFLGRLAVQVTTYVLSGLMIILAAWQVLYYFRSAPMEKITHSRLAVGMALAFTGVILAFNPSYLENILPFIWGLALLFGAFLKFQYAFDEKAVHIEKWWIMLIFSAFSLVIGILCLANPAFLGNHRELFIGIFLVAEAVLDIVVYLLLTRALKKMNAAPAAAPAGNPAGFAPVTPESPESADSVPPSAPEAPEESAEAAPEA